MNVFVFPGQGSQFLGMFEPFQKNDRFLKFLHEINKIDPTIIEIYEKGPEDLIKETRYAQPAIFTISSMLDKFLKENNIFPDVVTGHSLGEYSAFFSANIFDFSMGLALVYERGKIMHRISQELNGGMWAIIGDKEIIKENILEFDNLWIANYNSNEQIIISGDKEAFKIYEEKIKNKVKRIIPLSVSGPFHCPLMKKAQDEFYYYIKDLDFKDPEILTISSTTGEEVKSGKEAKEILIMQFTSPVLWIDTILKLDSLGVINFIEVGPGKVLQGLIKKILSSAKILGIDKPDDIDKIKGVI
jgi:[acyl-carrier-protein] S-malonyltransferase